MVDCGPDWVARHANLRLPMLTRRHSNRQSARKLRRSSQATRCGETRFLPRPLLSQRALVSALLVGPFLLLAMGCDREPEPPPPPRHLVLITVDTLRSDHLGAYGSDLGLTPEIDRLARESTLFTSAYAASAFTLPSIAAILTGRYPEELGIWNNESGVPEWAETIASHLHVHGWNTSAVVSNFVLRSSTGLDHFFDTFDDTFPDREAVRKWPERIAPQTTDAALEALDDCAMDNEPCFLWVHYQDPHGPYTPPAKLRAQYIEAERSAERGTTLLPVGTDSQGLGGIPKYQFIEDQQEVAFYRAGYDAEIRLMDREVGRLLAGMDLRGLTEETAIVFAADHGEGLGEDDYWFAHGAFLTDALVRVPLLIRVPGRSPSRRDDVVSLIDILPTLDPLMLGDVLTEKTTTYRGRDLFARDAENQTSTPYMATLGSSGTQRYGLVRGDSKIVASYRDKKWSIELFNRDSDSIDRSNSAPGTTKRLRRALVAMRNSLEIPKTRVRPEISPEVRANLEALGYVARPEPTADASPASD